MKRYGEPLLDAIQDNNHEKVMYLVENGASLSSYEHDNFGQTTPLIEAIRVEDGEIVDWLLDSGADVNERAGFFDSPLSVAVIETENNDITKKLLARGADVATRYLAGSIVSHLVFQRESNAHNARYLKLTHKQRELLETLLSSGYVHKPKGNDVCNSLYAQSLESDDIATLKLLLKYKVKVNQAATLRAAQKACKEGKVEGVELLLKNKLKPTPKGTIDAPSKGLLYHGIWGGNVRIVDLLLEYGASLAVNTRVGSHIDTYVVTAVVCGNADILEVILKHGGCPNQVSGCSPRRSPIVQAAVDGRSDLVSILIEHGAKAELDIPFRGESALEIVKKRGFFDIVALVENASS